METTAALWCTASCTKMRVLNVCIAEYLIHVVWCCFSTSVFSICYVYAWSERQDHSDIFNESWRDAIFESLSMYGGYALDWIVCGLVRRAVYKLTVFWRRDAHLSSVSPQHSEVRRWIKTANRFQWIELNLNGTEMDLMWNLPNQCLSFSCRIDV